MQTFYSHIVAHVVMFGIATLNVYRNIVLHVLISNCVCVCATSPFTAIMCYLLSYASALASVMKPFYSHIIIHVVMFGTVILNV